MATKPYPNCCLKTCLIISTFCFMFASATLFRADFVRLASRAKTRFVSRRMWQSSGLFIARSRVRRLQKYRALGDVFALETSQVKFPLSGACGVPAAMGNDGAMPECDDDPRAAAALNGSNWFGTTSGCCNT